MRKILLLLAVVLLGGAIATVSLQPDTFMVERSTSIGAPAVAVFAYINDLHRWETWSPWGALDPNMDKSYSGAATGVGAVYAWKGNSKVGEGRMTITESVPADHIGIHMEFLKPFASVSEVIFTLKAADPTHTLLSWTMQSHSNFIVKAMGLVVNIDAEVGSDFERGLALLKAQLEGQPTAVGGH